MTFWEHEDIFLKKTLVLTMRPFVTPLLFCCLDADTTTSSFLDQDMKHPEESRTHRQRSPQSLKLCEVKLPCQPGLLYSFPSPASTIHHKPGRWTHQKLVLSLLWQPEVQSKPVGRAVLPRGPAGLCSSLPPSYFWWMLVLENYK